MTDTPRAPARLEVRFGPAGERCAAWLYLPMESASPPPLVILGHGLGATRELGLDAYGERFAAAGMAALAFTYRGFGDSEGLPRQALSVRRQLEDWDAALTFARGLDVIDASQIAIWGSSFGGGHVIRVAARHPELAAAVSQCPFTDGLASTRARGLRAAVRTMPAMVRDVLATVTGGKPVTVPVAGPPSSTALMVAPDALPGYSALIPDGYPYLNEMPARSALEIMRYRPGRAARLVAIPIMFCVSRDDSVAPTHTTVRHARRARQGTIELFGAGHFDFYVGDDFEDASSRQVAFLREHFEMASR